MAINTTSFTNTPQAGDDLLLSSKTGLNEDSLNIVYLDVMSNDLGGNAKTLYSLDNGIDDDGKTGADLLIQDTAKTESLSTDTSLNGAKIWISNGKVGYDANTFSADFQAKLQHLAQGESLTDSFTYAIRLGNGTLSWATATVQIAGKNDAVTITLADTTGAVVEDAASTPDSNDSQTATGSISFKDIDLSDTHTATFVKSDGHESRLGTFSLAPVAEAANAETGSVAWTYTLNNADAQYLAEGQTVTEVYTVKINDGHGSTATQKVSITITGTNDAVNIRSGVQAGTVTEDGALRAGTSDDDHESTEHDDHDDEHDDDHDEHDDHDHHESDEHHEQPQQSAHGVIKFTDADQSDTHTATVNNNGVSALGALTLQVHEERGDDDGDASHGSVAWTYTLNNDAAQSLAAGEQVTEVFEVTVSDGHGSTKTETVTITVNGTNDAPVITNAESQLLGSVKEDDSLFISGQLSASDVDHGATQTWSVQNSAVGAYGSIAVDAATGQWTYTLANDADNVQALAVGESHDETFTIRVDDGQGGSVDQTVTVTVNGTNDAAVLSSATADLIETNEVLSTSGTLTISDIDSPATFVAQVDQAGLYGTFNIGTDGAWTYVANSAHDEFAEGITYTDTFAVTSVDGTATSVTVNILGTNDAAVLSSAAVVLDETNAALSTSGVLSISDVDNAAQFIAQDAALGSNGLFSIDADGNWSYTANSAFDNLNAGDSVSDTFIVKAIDGTETSVKVIINGTNDAAVLSSAIVALDETNAALSTSGVLSISDVDNAAQLIAQDAAPGSNGLFSIDADGNWSYTANSAFDNLNVGDSISDTFIVKAIDGTETSVKVTINGTNDAAVLSSATVNLTETNAALTTSGALTISDVDSAATFVAQTGVIGSYGTFNVGTNGAWTYATNGAHNEFAAGITYTDTFAVTSADGTATSVKVNILGTNDAPVLLDAITTFEEVSFNGGWGFTSASNLSGGLWHTDNPGNHLEIGAGTVYGAGTTSQVNELEANGGDPSNLYTDINAVAGTSYAVSFDYSPRAGVQSSSNISVFWGGNLVGHLSGSTTGMQHYSLNLPVSADGTYRLEFRADDKSGAGGLLDNIAVQHDGAVSATVIEQVTPAGNLSTSGSLWFTDLDMNDVHLVSATGTPLNGVLGSLTAVKNTESTSTGAAGKLTWTYTVADAAVEYLAAGQTKVESFTITLDDQHDGIITKQINVTVAGTNDAPVVAALDVTAAVTEIGIADGNLSDSGIISFTDADLADVHSLSAVTPSAGTLGTLTASVSADTTGNGAGGAVTWSYSVAASAVEYLAVGETKTETFTFNVLDGHGGSVSRTVSVTVTGTNDAPVITNAESQLLGSVKEDDSLSISGQLSASDVDHGASQTWSVQNSAVGTYGSIAVDAATGQWTYTLNNNADNVQALAAGESHDESFTIRVDDGQGGSVDQTVTITVNGTNDAAVLSSTTANLTESNAALTTSGTLTISDIDSAATFVAQVNQVGSYGTFNVGTNGAWTYAANSAHNEFVAGATYTDTFAVTSADGTATSVTVNILGTNDAAVLSTATTNLTETNAALATSGTLTISDVDSAAAFVAQTGVAGSYGTFNIGTDGAWTYVAGSAHNEFVAGATYTDTFAVTSADGTATSVKVNILGTNDAAVLSTATANLTETDAALTTSGALTVSDVDSAATFVARTGVVGSYGTFNIGTNGAWTYTAGNAHNEFAAGTTYTDTFAVTSADGTATSVTVNILGTNDAPVFVSTGALLDFNGSVNLANYQGYSLSGFNWYPYAYGDGDNSMAYTYQNMNISGTVDGIIKRVDGADFSLDSLRASSYIYQGDYHTTTMTGYNNGVLVANQTISLIPGVYQTFAFGSGWSNVDEVRFDSGYYYTFLDNVVLSQGNAQANSVTEQITPIANLSVSNVLNFSDADLTDVHLVSSSGTPIGNVLGSLSAVKTADTTGTGVGGKLTWTYTVSASAVEYLATGQTKVESFNITVNDQHGGIITKQIDVVITGTNDAPVVTNTAAALVGSVKEDASLIAVGQLSATDVDQGSVLTWSVQGNATGTYGAITVDNTGKWVYTLNNNAANVQALAAGESHNDVFTVRVTDDKGAFVDQSVTVTANGSNETTLTGTLTVDNSFELYVSTNDSQLGTLLATGSNWAAAYNFAAQLTHGVSNYVHIVAHNVGGPGGLLGQFSLSDAQFAFANSSTVEYTNAADWKVSLSGFGGTYSTPVNEGVNGVGPWGYISPISGSSNWIWNYNSIGSGDFNNEYFSMKINPIVFPAGVAGEAIQLAISDASLGLKQGLLDLTVSGLPSGWVLNSGLRLDDGSWSVQTANPSTLAIKAPADFSGAMLVNISESWTNADGTTGTTTIMDNVEVYAPGAPIFAWSGDDNLTGSAGADLFALGQPIGNVTVFNFDASADKIDLMGFAGMTSFADVQQNLSVDADGNALITLADGQTIMLKGIDPTALNASDFVFNETPVTHNSGNMVVGDGAMLPLGGIIDNSGSIALQSTGDATRIELIMGGVSLQGHGHVTLADNDSNIIFGATSNTTLTNIDNIISGAGQLGQGQLILDNQSIIVANGTHALTIDTGANTVINSGTLESTGTGGLIINSAVSNSGLLWAHGGDLIVNGAVNSGSALIDNGGDIEFADASSANVSFGAGSSNILKLDDADRFTGSVSDLNAGDAIDLANFNSDNATMSYADNADHSGGTLSITNGAHEIVNITLVGQYLDSGFALAADGSAGTMISYQ